MNIFDVLSEDGNALIANIRANMESAGQNATGKTGKSLRIEIKQEGNKFKLQLLGRAFFMTVQTGRGPTKPGASMSSPSLYDAIKEWVEAKGIAANPWAITKSIHERGTKLWRQGGRTDIVDPAIDDFVNNVSEHLLDAVADEFVLKVRAMKW